MYNVLKIIVAFVVAILFFAGIAAYTIIPMYCMYVRSLWGVLLYIPLLIPLMVYLAFIGGIAAIFDEVF